MGLKAIPKNILSTCTALLLLLTSSHLLKGASATIISSGQLPQYTPLILPSLRTNVTTPLSTNSISIDAWADAARRDPWRQSAEQQEAISTLKSMFEGQTDPAHAANTIASIYNPLLIKGFQNSPVAVLWTMMCEATQLLGGDHKIDGYMITLLNTLHRLPDVIGADGKPITGGAYSDYRVYWRDLPSLAVMFREYAVDIDDDEGKEMPDDFGDWTPAQSAKLLNVMTFGALYLVAGEKDISMAQRAEFMLMDGIEEPYQTAEEQRGAATAVPPAAIWMTLAGEKIYELCKANFMDNGKGRGFTLARWAMWKTKFGDIAGNEGLTADVRDIAAQVAAAMGNIG